MDWRRSRGSAAQNLGISDEALRTLVRAIRKIMRDFQVADFGLVADLCQALPELAAELDEGK